MLISPIATAAALCAAFRASRSHWLSAGLLAVCAVFWQAYFAAVHRRAT